MFDVETNEPLFKQWLDRLDSALISNPAMERRVRKDIREVILDVRSKVIRDSGDAFKNGDPRGTRRAIVESSDDTTTDNAAATAGVSAVNYVSKGYVCVSLTEHTA